MKTLKLTGLGRLCMHMYDNNKKTIFFDNNHDAGYWTIRGAHCWPIIGCAISRRTTRFEFVGAIYGGERCSAITRWCAITSKDDTWFKSYPIELFNWITNKPRFLNLVLFNWKLSIENERTFRDVMIWSWYQKRKIFLACSDNAVWIHFIDWNQLVAWKL